MSRAREIADIKRHWHQLLDQHNSGALSDKVAPVAIALWATLNVDKLIALAEAGADDR